MKEFIINFKLNAGVKVIAIMWSGNLHPIQFIITVLRCLSVSSEKLLRS
jgi:hypothetical protein